MAVIEQKESTDTTVERLYDDAIYYGKLVGEMVGRIYVQNGMHPPRIERSIWTGQIFNAQEKPNHIVICTMPSAEAQHNNLTPALMALSHAITELSRESGILYIPKPDLKYGYTEDEHTGITTLSSTFELGVLAGK